MCEFQFDWRCVGAIFCTNYDPKDIFSCIFEHIHLIEWPYLSFGGYSYQTVLSNSDYV